MSTFSLLQISLDQTIGRDSFLEAAAGSETVTKADLAQLYRELYGIVVSKIPEGDANVLKAQLDGRGFPVEIVADEELPPLPEEFQVQRVETADGWLRFTDSMGRVTSRALEDLVFLAGGLVQRTRAKSEKIMNASSRREDPETRMERTYKEEIEKEFRFEFFFWSDPHRLKLALGATNAIFVGDRTVQLHKLEVIADAAAELRGLLPPERTNLGLTDPEKLYPSLRAYSEEIRWHFHQLSKSC